MNTNLFIYKTFRFVCRNRRGINWYYNDRHNENYCNKFFDLKQHVKRYIEKDVQTKLGQRRGSQNMNISRDF